jgi:hypothetical protein
MLWWLKARRTFTVLPASLAVFALTTAAFQDAVVDLPAFLSGAGGPVLLMLMVPVPLCAAMVMSLDARLPDAEDTGTRFIGLYDAGLVVLVVGSAVLLGWAMGETLDSPAALSAGRNSAFLTGLTLSVRPFVGPPAVMAPIVWIFAVIFFGFDQARQPHFWTVLPEESDHPIAMAAAIWVLAVGLILHITIRHNHRED